VIPALGQSRLTGLLEACGVSVERGSVVVERGSGRTTNARYFAGGDCVNGGREVVDAVADGKRAALGIVGEISRKGAKTQRGAKEGGEVGNG
jgi:dihydropyrimidine dehydrogenase (NAD+) subunit PreT